MNSEFKQIHGGTYYGRLVDEDDPTEIYDTLYVIPDQVQSCIDGYPMHLDMFEEGPGGPSDHILIPFCISRYNPEVIEYRAAVGKTVQELYINDDGFFNLSGNLLYKDAAHTILCTSVSDLYTVSDFGGSVDEEAVNALIDARFNNNNGTLPNNDDHLKFDDKVTSPVTSATLDDDGYYNVTYAPGIGAGSTT